MLKEILLTDDERDGILGMCQYTLNRMKEDLPLSKVVRKSACARVGLIICKVKGHVPHYNETYIAEKGGWKRQGDVWEFTNPTKIPGYDWHDHRTSKQLIGERYTIP